MKKPIKPRPKTSHQPKFKPQPGYIRVAFALTSADYSIINKCAAERGLGKHAHSAALRLILREWKTWKDRQHHPVLIAIPPDMLPSRYLPDEEE